MMLGNCFTTEQFCARHDDLPASIMKQVSNEYCVPLTDLFNLSVLQGDFPSEMKLAKVLPIYKADNHQLIQNYRPIFVLIFFQKYMKE